MTSRAPYYTRPRNPVQPAESASVITCGILAAVRRFSEPHRRPGDQLGALAAITKSNISACAYRGQECCLCTTPPVSRGQTFRESLGTIASIPWTAPECWRDRKSVY